MNDMGAGTAGQQMERVFAPLHGMRKPAADRSTLAKAPPARKRAGRGWLAAALVLILAAAAVIGTLLSPRRPEPAPSPIPRMVAPEAGGRAAMPVVAPTPPVAPGSRRASETERTTSSRPQPTQRDRTLPQNRVRSVEPKPRPTTPAVIAEAGAEPPDRLLVCRSKSDKAACLYREVSEADGRLRRAYQTVAATGAAPSDMRRVRNTWRRALSRSRKEPLVSIGTLDGLTATLYDLPKAKPRP